jgi:hypothetical protein
MDTPKAGFVPAMRDIAQVEAHAVSHKGVVRIAAINKNPDSFVALRLQVPAMGRAQVSVRELGGKGFFEREVEQRDASLELNGGRLDLNLSKHSFSVITIKPR